MKIMVIYSLGHFSLLNVEIEMNSDFRKRHHSNIFNDQYRIVLHIFKCAIVRINTDKIDEQNLPQWFLKGKMALTINVLFMIHRQGDDASSLVTVYY